MKDPLTPEQRHRAMTNVKLKNGSLEIAIGRELRKRGLKFKKHVKHLPGTPDIVFPECKVAIFIDGDFWHGYRLPAWEHKLNDFWKEKIWANRRRDARNFRRLRNSDWKVIRLWQHDLKRDLQSCVGRIEATLNENKALKLKPRRTKKS